MAGPPVQLPAQADISIGDPVCLFANEYYTPLHNEFPNVQYLDHLGKFGRTKPQSSTVNFYFSTRPTGFTQDKILAPFAEATYFINLANFNDFEVDHEFPVIGRRTMLLNARRIYREGKGTEMILLALEDITDHKRWEEALPSLSRIAELRPRDFEPCLDMGRLLHALRRPGEAVRWLRLLCAGYARPLVGTLRSGGRGIVEQAHGLRDLGEGPHADVAGLDAAHAPFDAAPGLDAPDALDDRVGRAHVEGDGLGGRGPRLQPEPPLRPLEGAVDDLLRVLDHRGHELLGGEHAFFHEDRAQTLAGLHRLTRVHELPEAQAAGLPQRLPLPVERFK